MRPRLELMSLTSMLMLLLVLGLGQRARLRPGLRLRQRIRLGLGLRVEGLRSYQRVGRRRREVGSVGPGLPGWAGPRRARLALGEAGGRVAGPHDRWLLGARRGMARRRRPCAIRSDAPAERGGLAAWMRWCAGACYRHVIERRTCHWHDPWLPAEGCSWSPAPPWLGRAAGRAAGPGSFASGEHLTAEAVAGMAARGGSMRQRRGAENGERVCGRHRFRAVVGHSNLPRKLEQGGRQGPGRK